MFKVGFTEQAIVNDINLLANIKLANSLKGTKSKSDRLSNTVGGSSNVAKIKPAISPVMASQPPVNDLIPKLTTANNAGLSLNPITPLESAVPAPPSLPML